MTRLYRFPVLFLMLAMLQAFATGRVQAVQLSPDGAGQVLLYPVVSQGLRYDSLLSLTNEDAERPALLRVTVRDGAGGAARARLNVFLGAGESFTAAIDGQNMTPGADTCWTAFTAHPGASPPEAVRLELEGTAFLEVIEMATVTPGTATAALLNDPGRDCAAARLAVEDRAGPGGLEAPAGRITGGLTLIDVPLGLSFSLAPTTLDHFRESPIYRPVDVARPGLDDAEPAESVLFGRFAPGGKQSATLTSTWEHGVDAVSAVLMANTLDTDFNVETAIAANTDVLLAFPTRHHYQGETPDDERKPFVTRYVRSNVNAEPIEAPGQQFLLIARNRQGDTVIDTFGTKCTPARINSYPGPLLTGSQLNLRLGLEEVIPGMTVHEAGQVSEQDMCGSISATPVHELMEAGSLKMDFGGFSMTSLEGHVHHGLPVIGTSLTAVANETTTLANYGVVHAMRRDRDVTHPVSTAAPERKRLVTDEDRSPLRSDISGDGSVVAFETDRNLAPEDDGTGDPEKIGHDDVYLVIDDGQPVLATPTLSEYPEDVRDFDLSRDGGTLAYVVCEWVPDSPDTGHCEPQIRRFRGATGQTDRLMRPGEPVGGTWAPRVSADGNRIAFMSSLSQGDRIRVHDAAAGEYLVAAADARRLFAITDDGARVLFARGGPGISSDPPDDLRLADVDSDTEVSVLPPDLRARVDAPGDSMRIGDAVISASGRHVAFASAGAINGVFWYDREADDLRRLAPGSRLMQTARGLAMSADGQQVAFATEHRPNPGFPPGTDQVFLWQPGMPLRAVSVGTGGYAGNADSMAPAVSDDGRVISFASSATNIVKPGSLPDETRFPAWHVIRARLEP